MGGGGSALLPRLRGFVVLPAPDGCLVDLSGSPIAFRASKQVTALLGKMLPPASFAEALG